MTAPETPRKSWSRTRLTDDQATAVMRAVGYEPLEPYPNGRAPWRCRCTECGEISMPRLINARMGRGCNACSHQRVLAARRATAAAAAGAFIQAAGFEPLEPYASATTPWLCRCTRCGQTRNIWAQHMRTRGLTCRACTAEPAVDAA
ncbi:hypothetical protein ABZ752_22845 [Streptomyces roseifaciens]